MHYPMTIRRIDTPTNPRVPQLPKPLDKIPLVVIENDGYSLLQAEFAALAWEKHVSGASLHSVCSPIRNYAKMIGYEATIRIRFALEDGIPAYWGSKIKSTIVNVNLKHI